ncbi:hypothetical protein J2755_000550 [Methanohalophilus levihalophilus]|uniref:hypothetical protein n=1 Tax=Methanohalophilus levihalophilus TaxID=1431282 RepID=UPI001AE9C192|nr:hypothetical protein [Methanohalophilus levihalophilus]MBP2029630.1 hypothetical protein [Methanohalophilus levihalophilus]
MRKLFPILLIGTLSMLFAEVFSGASQMWFINGWGILVTFPLYLAHVLFFLGIALKTGKTSLSQLYLFGVIFALYEAWITKVLWAGYMDSEGPNAGTFLGVGLTEFPVLTFFWHPIMSFIVPILVFEILTGKVLSGHEWILKKTRRKTSLIVIFLILVATFIANGNGFNIVFANASFLGTIAIVILFLHLSKGASITDLEFGKRGFGLLSLYLLLLYIITFIYLLPDRIPTTITPYLTIAVFYAIPIALIYKSEWTGVYVETPEPYSYSKKDLATFLPISVLAVSFACLMPDISPGILAVTYFLLLLVGTLLFLWIVYTTSKKIISVR